MSRALCSDARNPNLAADPSVLFCAASLCRSKYLEWSNPAAGPPPGAATKRRFKRSLLSTAGNLVRWMGRLLPRRIHRRRSASRASISIGFLCSVSRGKRAFSSVGGAYRNQKKAQRPQGRACLPRRAFGRVEKCLLAAERLFHSIFGGVGKPGGTRGGAFLPPQRTGPGGKRSAGGLQPERRSEAPAWDEILPAHRGHIRPRGCWSFVVSCVRRPPSTMCCTQANRPLCKSQEEAGRFRPSRPSCDLSSCIAAFPSVLSQLKACEMHSSF